MANPNQAPQTEQQATEAAQAGEFDHLLGSGTEQEPVVAIDPQRPAEQAAVRPELTVASPASAEAERMQKLGSLNEMYGPSTGPKSRHYEQ